MSTVVSNDGTTIAYERTGSGAPVILVDGAMCHRGFGPARPLAERLAKHYTVYTYDRRGRGKSADAPDYSPAREVEDVDALIKEAGGSAFVYGISSGAVLALEAANSGLPIDKLAVYEPPLVVDDSREPFPADYPRQLDRLIAENRPGDAVKLFMRQVGTPGIAVAMMRLTPVWSKLKKVGPTLRYDTAVLGDVLYGKPLPADRWNAVTVPTLIADGGKSPAWMRNGVAALAKRLPHAQHRTIPGQTHMLKPDAIAPVLVEFFGS